MADQLERLRTALADRYRIERELGTGGMATVYLADDLKHRRRVAIKVLRPELAASVGPVRFLREIEIAAQLQHPHVLMLIDSGQADGFLYYIMPYVEGESLRERLAHEGELPVADTVKILRDVVDALAYAHEHGVVHRDIKPDNVMLSGRHALVTDFGIAKALSEAAGQDKLTTAGVALGTPAYMAPEQACADSHVDHRADIYAVGALAYELLAGHPPFSGSTAQSVLAAHVTDQPDPVSKYRQAVPPTLEQLVMRCLEKRPADRWQNANHMLMVLETLSTPSGGMSPTGARPVSPVMPWPMRRIGWAAGVVTLAVAVAAAVLVVRTGGDRVPTVAIHRQVTFTGNVTEAHISPDEDFLAYLVKHDSGMALNVRDLAGGTDVVITSSEQPLCCQGWSGDGRRVLVGSGNGERYAYPRLGGQAQALPGYPDSRLSMDGMQILGTSAQLAGIWFATLPAGPATFVSFLDSLDWTFGVEEHPAGGVYMILMTDETLSRSKLWNLTVDSAVRYSGAEQGVARRQVIVLEDSVLLLSPQWSPMGDAIYYLRERESTFDVWKVRVDQEGERDGVPVLLVSGLEMVTRDDGSTRFSLNADASRLYYTKGTAYRNLWVVAVRDGRIETRLLISGTARVTVPTPSPDGQQVAFIQETQGKSNVWVVPTEAGTPTQLTHVDSVYGNLAWAPDGQRIAFGLKRGSEATVATVGVRSGQIRVLESTDLSINGTLAWAPRSEILYQHRSMQNYSFLDPDTGGERPLITADSVQGWLLRVLPAADGRRVAAWLNPGDTPGHGVYILSPDDGRHVRLGGDRNFMPCGWSQDGRRIFAIEHGQRDLWSLPTDGSVPTVVLTLPFDPGFLGSGLGDDLFVFEEAGNLGDVWVVEDFDPDVPSKN